MRFLRIHLLTAVIATIAAGILLGINFYRKPVFKEERATPTFEIWVIGWPLPLSSGLSYQRPEDQKIVYDEIRRRIKAHDDTLWAATNYIDEVDRHYYRALVFNFATGSAILLTITAICELLTRMSSRRPASKREPR